MRHVPAPRPLSAPVSRPKTIRPVTARGAQVARHSRVRRAYLGSVVTVVVDGHAYRGTVYYVRSNGWASVETAHGRIASGPILH